ncbi:CapA family protein, partial [Phascolarctobacterium faecium]|uniref:CapA family protein n=2 Tax=Bacillota TaxID=1239 RepID=UPI001D079046
KQQVKENIAALKEAGAQLIIVNFHWGIEREYLPNDTQKKLAHLAIDEGADLVIGHHPHVLQGVEKYKDKYIAY